MTDQIDIYRFHLSQMLKLTRAAFEAHDVWQAAHDCLYPPIKGVDWAEDWWRYTFEGSPALPQPEAFTETVDMSSDQVVALSSLAKAVKEVIDKKTKPFKDWEHKRYIGPNEYLDGKTALVKPAKHGYVVAQFDDMGMKGDAKMLAFGWHPFPAMYFEDIPVVGEGDACTLSNISFLDKIFGEESLAVQTLYTELVCYYHDMLGLDKRSASFTAGLVMEGGATAEEALEKAGLSTLAAEHLKKLIARKAIGDGDSDAE